VLVTYYSTDYTDQSTTQAVQALNQVITQQAGPFDAEVADGYRAFAVAASPARGKTCNAGLLIKLPDAPGTCDIHPSPIGDALLAGTVVYAARAAAA